LVIAQQQTWGLNRDDLFASSDTEYRVRLLYAPLTALQGNYYLTPDSVLDFGSIFAAEILLALYQALY
jgi:hypothetical protein